jgi:predicted membrane-bound spermidine synthase
MHELVSQCANTLLVHVQVIQPMGSAYDHILGPLSNLILSSSILYKSLILIGP